MTIEPHSLSATRPLEQEAPDPPEASLKPKADGTIRVRRRLERRKRDLAMLNLAIDSKVRGCDLVRVRISVGA